MNKIFIHIPRVAGGSIWSVVAKRDDFSIMGHNARFKNFEYLKDKMKYSKYQNSFKFAFVRNPLDRLVSSYFYLKSGGNNKKDKKEADKYIGNKSFSEFVDDIDESYFKQIHLKPQHIWICKENKPLVDFIGKYENLENDLKRLSNEVNEVNVDFSNIPYLNFSKHKNYKKYYNNKQSQKIKELYKKDFKIFNYD